jgi:hypothetical protein
VVNPTIVMEVGQTYTFVQTDRSNYYHPLGFSYFPDGTHDGVEELEPSIGLGTDPSCAQDATCPAPMYFLNGEYLGEYSNIPQVKSRTTGVDYFGLDDYEPLFFRPLAEWTELGEFSIKLRFDDDSYQKDIFYFCHIHQFMTGRIKLVRNGVPVSNTNDPPLGYKYDEPGPFDLQCGTFGLDDFQLPNPECPYEFVCDPAPENQAFSECIDAIHCHMFAGMTTKVSSHSEIALFLHQMIPHHQNSVNMAKTLLMTNKVKCDDLTTADENPLCILELILRDIINGQNYQIQQMRNILRELNLPLENDCQVAIDNVKTGFQPTTMAPTMAPAVPPVDVAVKPATQSGSSTTSAFSDDIAVSRQSNKNTNYAKNTSKNNPNKRMMMRIGGNQGQNNQRARSKVGNRNHNGHMVARNNNGGTRGTTSRSKTGFVS